MGHHAQGLAWRRVLKPCVPAQGKAGAPMLSLRQAGEQQWAADLAVGRAKAYLVGSPYAAELGFASVLAGPLQVCLGRGRCLPRQCSERGYWRAPQ